MIKTRPKEEPVAWLGLVAIIGQILTGVSTGEVNITLITSAITLVIALFARSRVTPV